MMGTCVWENAKLITVENVLFGGVWGENKADGFWRDCWSQMALLLSKSVIPTAPSWIIYSHLFEDIYARAVSMNV